MGEAQNLDKGGFTITIITLNSLWICFCKQPALYDIHAVVSSEVETVALLSKLDVYKKE